MPIAQPFLPFQQSASVHHLRSVRRAFTPSGPPGPYKLPHEARDRLTAALQPYRNRDAAYSLAVFIGRFWSAPAKLPRSFCIDRRSLAKLHSLELTEGKVRGAIKALIEVGYIDRGVMHGSPYQPTPEGLRKKPVEFQFGLEFASLFQKANSRTKRARERAVERLLTARPLPIPGDPLRVSTASKAALPGMGLSGLKVPKFNQPELPRREYIRATKAKGLHQRHPTPSLKPLWSAGKPAFEKGQGF